MFLSYSQVKFLYVVSQNEKNDVSSPAYGHILTAQLHFCIQSFHVQ